MENLPYILYVDIFKALYGFLKVSLFFHRKRFKGLKDIGFRLNPYDPCVVKIIVNEKNTPLCVMLIILSLTMCIQKWMMISCSGSEILTKTNILEYFMFKESNNWFFGYRARFFHSRRSQGWYDQLHQEYGQK